ncbi:MAG: hypothetical protein WCJ64_27765 [Rhodospirillaceae bacterium]
MSDDHRVLKDHFVLYVDFLGVSDASTSCDEGQAGRLIKVLKTIAELRAPFSIDGEPQPDGSYKIRATPEISTFSDHIVASYPVPDNLTIPVALLMDIYLKILSDIAEKIAFDALSIGMLVRGALTIGKLYHSDGVVFGEAMVDAHRLESRVAIYPRVAVSSRIYGKIDLAERKRLVLDSDGIWHLNYFSNIINQVDPAEREAWVASCVEMIDSNITSFEENERWSEMTKWAWFKDKFSKL